MGPIASNIWGGRTYPANFIGPIGPNDNRVGQKPSGGGSVLGAQTSRPSSGGGGGYQQGGWYGNRQYWDGQFYEGGAPQAGGGGGGGGGEPQGPGPNDINELYAPQLEYLSKMEGQVNDTKKRELSNLDTQFAEQSAKLKPEEEQLMQALGAQENRFRNEITSAYDEAYRARNALGQQARSRFGRGSSAFGAVSELADQEFYRQQGNVNQERTQGELEFGLEKGRVKTYIADKLTSLEQWKRDAVSKINDNFTQLMNQINANRVATEQQKTREKMGLLQQTIAQSQAIAQADQQFKQQLALFAVQQIQSVQGRQFTPQEIQAQIADIMSGLNIGGSRPAANTGLAGRGGAGLFGRTNEDQQGLT